MICAARSVEIGDECLFGADVQTFDTDFHPIAPENRRFSSDPNRVACAPVRIGRNVFVGTRSMILKGVVIGHDAIIGAGSLVISNIPAGATATGRPAAVIGSAYASTNGEAP